MTDLSPEISIITATFNRRHLLPRVLDSLRSQSLQSFEWIIVDDGSTDGTGDYVASLDDPGIVYVYQENQGCNVARDRGEREIRGRYVIFLDSDDELYSSDTLETMLEAISGAPDDVGVVAFAVTTPEGGGGHSVFAADSMILGYEDLICGCKTRGEAFRIYKRAALDVAPWWTGGLGLMGIRWYEIARQYKFLYINRPALLYHMNLGDNLTSARSTIRRSGSMAAGYLILIENHKEGWLRACPEVYGRHLFHAAMYFSINGQSAMAFKLACRSLMHGAGNLNTLALLGSLLLPLDMRRNLFIWRSRNQGRL